MRALAVSITLVLLLAGCSQKAGPTAVMGASDPPILHGVVTDPAVRPIAGATLRVLGTNQSTTSRADGTFAFAGTLPREAALVLVASAPGFESASLQTSLPKEGSALVKMVLSRVASAAGTRDLLKFKGLLACQAAVAVGEERASGADCSAGLDKGQTEWSFSASPKLVAAVVEVVWAPTQPLAEGLGARLEHIDGSKVTVLVEKVSRSPLRLVIPQQTATQQFAAGGDLRLVVFAQPITDEDEQALAVSVDVDQTFEAFASLFYGTPPDPNYSILSAS